jgi:hypothetical protein
VKKRSATRIWAVVVVLVIAAVIGVASWRWWFSRRSIDVDVAMANVRVGDPLESVPLLELGIEDCWRKTPDTGEMVCHYQGAEHAYAIRFRATYVVEVAHDRRLGGPNLPPFNSPVDLVLLPER